MLKPENYTIEEADTFLENFALNPLIKTVTRSSSLTRTYSKIEKS